MYLILRKYAIQLASVQLTLACLNQNESFYKPSNLQPNLLDEALYCS